MTASARPWPPSISERISVLAELRRGNSGDAVTKLENVVSMIRNASDEVRRIQMDLRPSMLDDLGIAVTINWFCREFRESLFYDPDREADRDRGR